MHRFYLNTELAVNTTMYLNEYVTKHVRILRLKVNDKIELFDGIGNCFTAIIVQITKKCVCIDVIQVTSKKEQPNPVVCVAIGLIANEKMDIAIQKVTELGARTIIPIYSKYSQRIPFDRIDNRIAHWQNIIINSCCQCGQNYLPIITSPATYSQILDISHDYELKLVMSTQKHSDKLELNNNIKSVILLVGPEGGFTNAEITQAVTQNFRILHFNQFILRSETAAIAGLSLINFQLYS